MIQEMQDTINNSINPDPFELPVNTDVLFSNHKNIYKKGIEKRQRKMLEKISFIRPFLHKGEEILYITTGCSPVNFTEQFLTGWIVFALKRSLFIFTTERIFHIPTKQNFSYRNSICQILYADCHSIAMKGRTLVAEYKNGKVEKFIYIPGSGSKKIKAILKEISMEGQSSPTMARTHLCPRCTGLLVTGQYTCPNCSLEFKNVKQGRMISVMYPGGGYFYTGHPLLGLGDALVEIYFTLLVLITFIGAISGVADSVSAFVFFSLILALEKAVSVYHCNNFIREFIPKEKCIKTLTSETKTQQPPEVTPEPKPEEVLSASWSNF